MYVDFGPKKKETNGKEVKRTVGSAIYLKKYIPNFFSEMQIDLKVLYFGPKKNKLNEHDG